MAAARVLPQFEPLWPDREASTLVLVAPAALTVYSVVMVFVLEWQVLRGQAGERIRARGQDPHQVVALTGATMWFSPLSTAWILSWFGLPLTAFGIYAIVSVLGIAFWNWRYREVIRRSWSA